MTTKDYLSMPYNVILRHVTDESGSYYFATVQELEGCMSDGKTPEEAYKNIYEAMEGWFEVMLENGHPIPEPINTDNYSGKYVIRIPKSLHRKLAQRAKEEGVSLNQYTLHKLSAI